MAFRKRHCQLLLQKKGKHTPMLPLSRRESIEMNWLSFPPACELLCVSPTSVVSDGDTGMADRLATQDSTGTECHVCGGQPISARFVFCQRCGTTAYCSVEHRKQDWKTHKRNCQGFSDSSNGETDEKDTAKTEETLVEYIVRNLQENYYCVVDNFHARELGLAVLEEVKYLKKQGEFKDGELVSPGGNGKSTGKRIREDQITWASGKEPRCKAIAQHMTVMDALMARCNSLIEEHDIKNRTKAMVACYPGNGSHYKRHVDNPHKDGRCITALYYLNQGWTRENGGILKLYPGSRQEPVEVLPLFNRLLLFWSDRRNPHEVEPAYKMRYAITLWYFDKAEREQYCEYLNKKPASQDTKAENLRKKNGISTSGRGGESS